MLKNYLLKKGFGKKSITTRSQIAEALLKKYGGDDFEVNSAGINPDVIVTGRKAHAGGWIS